MERMIALISAGPWRGVGAETSQRTPFSVLFAGRVKNFYKEYREHSEGKRKDDIRRLFFSLLTALTVLFVN